MEKNKMKINSIYSGFKLIEKDSVSEIKSETFLFEHEKSGARLLKIVNDDDNNVFSISFRTPPEDDSGLPHVLEHSVLCGSKKFRSKEPFVELIKGSLNTFLNAMTFSDKTMYPIASKNRKDFLNLMNVYMDAVLNPLIYENEKIFMQEGWHYELENKDAPLIYKGVVYNEMKGSFSSPLRVLYSLMEKNLLPDTPYGFESGGIPDDIISLTQEKLLAFHKKYYHPSNSYIYLYGDGDLLEELDFLDREYLSNFNKEKIDSEINDQKPFTKEKIIEDFYPVSKDDDKGDKTFYSLSFVTGSSGDAEFILALDILKKILLDSEAAPLKKALLDAGIGKDIIGIADTDINQPMFGIIAKDAKDGLEKKFKDIIFKTLKDLVDNGIDKDLIKGEINSDEFSIREAEFGYPKGLVYNIISMSSWLYDKDPLMHLKYEKLFKNIRDDEKYFENFITKYLLNNKHQLYITLKPKPGMISENEIRIEEKLEEYKSGLSDGELSEIVKTSKELIERQAAPDRPEDLRTIPMLSIDDIGKKSEKFPLLEKEISGVEVFHHPVYTNKIGYVNLLFNTSSVPENLIPYISLLSTLLGKIDTGKFNYSDLSNRININTGGIGFSPDIISQKNSSEIFTTYLVVKGKVLTENFSYLFDLISEIITGSIFEDKSRIEELINKIKSRFEMKIMNDGHLYAKKRLFSYFSRSGRYIDLISGISYYEFIKKIEKDFKRDSEEILSNLKKVCEIIFNKKNLLVSFTAEDEEYDKFSQSSNKFLENLPNEKFESVEYELKSNDKNEGLLIPSQVQYNAKGFNFRKAGFEYNGVLSVARTIIGLDFLWNKVRVQGGAYGSMISIERDGNLYIGSYRDPNLKKTLDIFSEVPSYLSKFATSEEEMLKYIIGTISKIDSHFSPAQKGSIAARLKISGVEYKDRQKHRDEILSSSVEDIIKCAELFNKVIEEDYFTVLGNENKIKDEKDIFNELIKLF